MNVSDQRATDAMDATESTFGLRIQLTIHDFEF